MVAKQRGNVKLLNHSTQIAATTTAGEIMGMLAAKGAKSINIEYDRGEPVGLAFMIAVPTPRGSVDMAFRMPCNPQGALAAMRRSGVRQGLLSLDQAKRVAWRIQKDWVESQLAFIECEQASMAQAFLSYLVLNSGQTLFERITEDPARLLGAGNPDEQPDNVVEMRR